jgi:uncharacterized protein (TIGR02302 family)
VNRFERLVRITQTSLFWEALWHGLYPVFGVVGLFVLVSLLGLWLVVPSLWKMAGLAVFGLAVLFALAPLMRVRWPSREAAIDRLDYVSNLKHRPARSFADKLALGSQDPASTFLWEKHQRQIADQVGRMAPALPSPRLADRDPYAFRLWLILGIVTSVFLTGPDRFSRLAAAFEKVPVNRAAFRLDGWIDPPHYTKQPPLMLDLASYQEEAPSPTSSDLRAPVNSIVVIRFSGAGSVEVTPVRGLEPVPIPLPPASSAQEPALWTEQRFKVTGHAEITLRPRSGFLRKLSILATPDVAPVITLTSPPVAAGKGTLGFNYLARDDYGFKTLDAVIAALPTSPDRSGPSQRSLIEPPRAALAPPLDPRSDQPLKGTLDFSSHPWAGAKVRMVIQGVDEAGQSGYSAPVELVLPQRSFTDELAKALVEQRRNLILNPDDRKLVQGALDSLLIAPERFTRQWGVFLGLKLAASRLREASTDAGLIEVADWLWAMAVEIEDGALGDAEKALRAAEKRLSEAIENGASTEEIKRLSDELRQAMNRYMKELAQKSKGNKDQAGQQSEQRSITQDQLNQLLKQIEELTRQGDTEGAQALLQTLRSILENLQTAENSGGGNGQGEGMESLSRQLDDLSRDQNRLRDETYQQDQQEMPNQGGKASPSLSERQKALQDRLKDAQRQMQEQGLENEPGFGEAEGAMREAEQALREGRNGESAEAQGRASEGLRQGRQGLARQARKMNEGQGQASGEDPAEGQKGTGQMGARQLDPLGRPMRGSPLDGGGTRLPEADESFVQRSRRILDELRERFSTPSRPRQELDYLERLLQRKGETP